MTNVRWWMQEWRFPAQAVRIQAARFRVASSSVSIVWAVLDSLVNKLNTSTSAARYPWAQ